MFSRRRKANASCSSVGRVTAAQLLLSFLAVSPTPSYAASNSDVNEQVVLPVGPYPITPLRPQPPDPAEHTFTLRHIYHHGTDRHPTLHRKHDITDPEAQVWLAAEDGYKEHNIQTLSAKSNAVRIERLVDRRPSVVDPMVALGRERGYVSVMSPDAWTMDDVPGPNITDKETVLNLAIMAANAYVQTPGKGDWLEVGEPYNNSADFGWETDGLRGHIWADEDNSTIVIGLKGTSPAVFDGDGTTTNDKINDNLFSSCCCAQQGPWTWHQVCDCATGTYSCNNTCVSKALREENRYYQAARELYANVTELYPDSNIWIAGHSLGGAVSSLLGLTYGIPVVTFEAVPEALAAGRLGLPVPPGSDAGIPQTREYTGTFHFGHTADPIFIGTCNGATASCTFGGYAMESACHTGSECVYDVVADKGWRVGIGTHKILSVIHDVLMKYDTVPECKFTPECRDCANWKFYESNGTEPTTTTSMPTSTATTRTRTETCKTPGWWGCLDETTTTTGDVTTTTSSSISSTSTCETPGWFGCKDKTTTTTITTTAEDITTTTTTTTKPVTSPTESVPTPTTTCATPGKFWGCNDQTSTESTSTVPTSSTTTCETPGRLWGCNDETTATSTSTDSTSTSTCETPGRLWGCNDQTETEGSSTNTCETPGRLWGCHDTTTVEDAESKLSHPITSPPAAPTSVPTSPATAPAESTPQSGRCLQRNWFGFCKEWDADVTGEWADEV